MVDVYLEICKSQLLGGAVMLKKILLWSILPIIVGTATAYELATGFKSLWPANQVAQYSVSTVKRPSPDRVRAGTLWPQLRGYLKALGGRLEELGKERLTFAGTLDRAGEQSVAFVAISEFPDRLRLTTQSAAQTRTISFDKQAPIVVGDTLSVADQNLIESLVNDAAEHFFDAQAQGAPTRHLGNRFRADDGSTENYTGPYHDIFSMQDTVTGPATREQTKLYYFNSETHLLERVTYQISRNGETVEVETRFSDWQKVQDQQVAHRIVRLEKGQPVISLTITSATIAARLNDGLF
jgi:hypothetical protein